ncbi:DUF2336 domain-containing protein [Elioraea sp.]|uniref:DUF2336 domain-containing protein n=1 Tax=Elioraea sp. TaxID=2185103 RepID=UPI0021DE304F|nr:DUF2336 domain-containing protein [Elioraea sp.]GIX09148.1 MAG: hypothetical protein KatS3mg116_0858 [Elioraea sp.]
MSTIRRPPMRAADYEDAKRIARHGSTDERAALARRADMAPELLFYLAADRDSDVRVAVAANGQTPPQADRLLADDADERVRAALARKIAALAPQLDPNSQDRLQKLTAETLARLVRDTAVQVRAAIAEVVKSMPDAPRDLVLALAQDTEIPVAGPVLELSPLLSTEDLLALVHAPPGPETVSAIARRPHLNETVSDAIAQTANSPAITALLRNRSAQIREATLDALIARASEHVEWHEPLVHRPHLSARAARALSTIVAEHLVQALATRPDLDPATAEFLRRQVVKQIAWGTPPVPTHRSDLPLPVDAFAAAGELKSRGRLTEAHLLAAADRGEVRMVAAMLARAADVALSVVERAANLRSAKGLVALCWKAGFSMRAAASVQGLLGRLPPDAILAAPAGTWPLSEEEMRWHIAFLAREGAAAQRQQGSVPPAMQPASG